MTLAFEMRHRLATARGDEARGCVGADMSAADPTPFARALSQWEDRRVRWHQLFVDAGRAPQPFPAPKPLPCPVECGTAPDRDCPACGGRGFVLEAVGQDGAEVCVVQLGQVVRRWVKP